MTFFGQTTGKPRFAKVMTSIAGEMFSFGTGAILELHPDASDWPEPIRTWLRQRGPDAIAVSLEEGPPAWANVTTVKINPATFRTAPPAPPARRELLDKAAVLRRTGLSEEGFANALTMGFPTAYGTRVSDVIGPTGPSMEPLWSENDVNRWIERRQSLQGEQAHV